PGIARSEGRTARFSGKAPAHVADIPGGTAMSTPASTSGPGGQADATAASGRRGAPGAARAADVSDASSDAAAREKQMKQAEELLFAGPQRLGLAKGLFFVRFAADWVLPYPVLPPEEANAVEQAVRDLQRFVNETLDPVAIDREATIPPEIIAELGRLGVM